MKNQVVLIAFIITVIGLPAQAQSDERVLTGAVVRVDATNRVMTLSDTRTRKRTRVTIPTDATMSIDGVPATLGDFRRGNVATIRFIRRDDGVNEAVNARIPDPMVVVEVPTELATSASGNEMLSVAMPKTASNRYLSLFTGIAFVVMGFCVFVTRKLQRAT